MQATMNLKIKFPESFRPFVLCALAEHAHEWFELKPGQESLCMLLVAPVLDERLTPRRNGDGKVPIGVPSAKAS